jgi:hypothetical protein
LTIRAGKGDKDRETVLPDSLKSDLREHLEKVRDLFERDRQDKVAGVQLPGALERKYPNAGREWGWQWVFPSKSLSVDPRTRKIRRHHLHPNGLQKQVTSSKRGRFHQKSDRSYVEAQLCDPLAGKRL